MSTNNGDAQALNARGGAEEARLIAEGLRRLEGAARELYAHACRVYALLPPTNMRNKTRCDVSRAAVYARSAARGMEQARDDLERAAELDYLERAVRGAGG